MFFSLRQLNLYVPETFYSNYIRILEKRSRREILMQASVFRFGHIVRSIIESVLSVFGIVGGWRLFRTNMRSSCGKKRLMSSCNFGFYQMVIEVSTSFSLEFARLVGS